MPVSGHAADNGFISLLEAKLDGGTHANHHDHEMIAAVEGEIAADLLINNPVAVPKLVDLDEEGKARRCRVGEIIGLLGWAKNKEPFREREEGLVPGPDLLSGRERLACVDHPAFVEHQPGPGWNGRRRTIKKIDGHRKRNRDPRDDAKAGHAAI